MARNLIEILIAARDQASGTIQKVNAEVGKMGAATSLAAGGINALSIGIVAGVTAMGSALAAARSLSDQLERVSLTASETGASVNEVRILQQSLRNLGLGAEDADAAMRILNRRIAEGHPLLAELGVTAKSSYGAFLQLSEVLSGIDDPARRTQITFELLGRGGARLASAMLRLKDEAERVKSTFARFGGFLSTSDIKTAEDLDAALDELDTTWSALWTRARLTLVPVAKLLVDILETTLKLTAATRPGGWAGLVAEEKFLRPKEEGGGKWALTQAEMTVPGVEVSARGPTEERKKQIKEIGELLRVDALAAARLAEILDRAASKAAGIKMREQIEEAKKLLGIPLDTTPILEAVSALRRELDANPLEMELQLRTTTPEKPTMAGAVEVPAPRPSPAFDTEAVKEQWRADLDEMAAAAFTLNEQLNLAFSQVQGSLAMALEGLILQGRSFADVMLAIIRDLVSAIIREFARLAAIKFLSGLLSLIPGVNIVGNILSLPAIQTMRATSTPPPTGVSSVETRYYINAIDAKSFADSLRSPSAGIYRAHLRQSELAAIYG